MKMGTKSLLVGAHTWFIHPWFVALGWYKLYGFPVDFRLWIAFLIHDWGYWGKTAMDDEDGETHPYWAAEIMGRWFGRDWYWFCLLHSRFLSRKLDRPFSRLCAADKYAIALTPWWLYLPGVWMTGELREYMSVEKHVEENGEYGITWKEARRWHRNLQAGMAAWVRENAKSAWRPGVTAFAPHYKSPQS